MPASESETTDRQCVRPLRPLEVSLKAKQAHPGDGTAFKMLRPGPQGFDGPLLVDEAERGRVECTAFRGESNVLWPHRLVTPLAEMSFDGLGRPFAVDLPRDVSHRWLRR